MKSKLIHIKDYFLPGSNYSPFWQYSENAQIIEFDGKTICYTNYLLEVLETFENDRRPPLTPLLFAIMATNEDGMQQIGKLISTRGEFYKFLQNIHALPESYKTSANRIVLFNTLFKNAPEKYTFYTDNLPLAQAFGKYRTLFSENKPPEKWWANGILNNSKPLYRIIFPTTKSIKDAIDSNPFVIPRNKITLPPILPANNDTFINELIDQRKTEKIGLLIPSLLAGLRIPVHHSEPGIQPMGGTADISNKGDLSRLLLSELANDDDTLMLRLANQEALYLERETPPKRSNKTRYILIDVSLKNWGSPKIMAYAVALALAIHPQNDIRCEIWVLSGESFFSIETNPPNPMLIENSLSTVSTNLHSTTAATNLIKSLSAKKDYEIVLIHEHSIQYEEWQVWLTEQSEKIKFIIHTERNGNLHVYEKGKLGKRKIQSMMLDLDVKRTWSRKVIETPEKYYNHSDLSLESVPILFPANQWADDIVLSPKTIFLIQGSHIFAQWSWFTGEKPNKDDIRNNLFRPIPLTYQTKHCGIIVLGKKIFLFQYLENRGEVLITNIQKNQTYDTIKVCYPGDEVEVFFDLNSFFITVSDKVYSIDSNLKLISHDWRYVGKIHKKVSARKRITMKKIGLYPLRYLFRIEQFLPHVWETPEYIKINSLGFNTHTAFSFFEFKSHLTSKKDFEIIGYRDNDQYTFSDGSCIIDTNCGILILKSSNNKVPPIYLNKNPYVTICATQEHLCISETSMIDVYKRWTPETVELYITKLRGEKRLMIDYIHQTNQIPIPKIHQWVNDFLDSTDSPLIVKWSHASTLTAGLKNRFKTETSYKIKSFADKSNKMLTILEQEEFEEQILFPFINTIIEHELKTHTRR
ncbi:MAG: hypothetical protein H6607_06345 [Flavobacteriales bacterium]|nr:hypothetical protein [Flavobacteriales bacterium]